MKPFKCQNQQDKENFPIHVLWWVIFVLTNYRQLLLYSTPIDFKKTKDPFSCARYSYLLHHIAQSKE